MSGNERHMDRTRGGAGDAGGDPKLTAFALGELSGAERDEVAQRIAADAAARSEVDAARRAADALTAALATESAASAPALTPAQRAAVTATAAGLGRSGRPTWLRAVSLYGGLACAAGLAAVAGVSLMQRDAGVVKGLGDERSITASLEMPLGAPAPSSPATSARPNAPASGEARDVTRSTRYLRDFDVEVAQGAAAAPLASGERGAPAGAKPKDAKLRGQSVDKAAASDRGVLGGADDDRAAGSELAAGEAAAQEEAEVEIDAEELLREEPAAKPDAWNTEGYAALVENPFVRTSVDSFSTFSIDVDTASYSNVRRFIREGAQVPPDAVRIEELINYFPYGYVAPAPGAEHPFAVHVAVAAAPWKREHRLVRIGLAAEALDLRERPAANLVFLVDVSGSMADPNKLPLVKRALALVVEQLGEGDRVAIVVYASAEGLALPPTSGAAREAILQTLERLDAGGSTNGGAGIQLAYRTAREGFVEGGINRVILCTDGDFNVGVTSDGALERLIGEEAKSGVFLTVLGFGTGNWQDAKMEALSNRGNGNFAYIDTLLEARKVLIEELGGTLATVAKDVKLQVEFNPAEVQAARLIGYENRILAHQDFLDDTKDAGEIGAGHTVTALYEVVPVGVPFAGPDLKEPRYQVPGTPTGASASGELLTVSLRYKRPAADTSVGFEVPVRDSGATFDGADVDTRFAAAVAAFGMVLRGSPHVGGASLTDVRAWALEALGEDRGGYRAGFVELVEALLRRK